MSTIAYPVTLHLLVPDRAPVPLKGVLSWDPAAPIEIHLSITHGTAETIWLLGRDLLTAGLHGPAGDGDVHLQPYTAEAHMLRIDLTSKDGSAGLIMDRATVGDFLRATWQACPAADEAAVITAALDVFDWTVRHVTDVDGAV